MVEFGNFPRYKGTGLNKLEKKEYDCPELKDIPRKYTGIK